MARRRIFLMLVIGVTAVARAGDLVGLSAADCYYDAFACDPAVPPTDAATWSAVKALFR